MARHSFGCRVDLQICSPVPTVHISGQVGHRQTVVECRVKHRAFFLVVLRNFDAGKRPVPPLFGSCPSGLETTGLRGFLVEVLNRSIDVYKTQ